MEKIILLVHVIAACSVIGLVLLQHGKGADMGAAFGSGASGSLFGVSGSSNLLSKLTALFVAVFFATSLTLAYMSSHHVGNGSVMKSVTSGVVAPKKVEVGADAVKADESVLPAVPAAEPDESPVAQPKDVPN
jgi:preprotein translocase subunit SecG